MFRYLSIILAVAALALSTASCGEYQRVLKSNDPEYHLDFAKRAFEEKKYTQAATALENIPQMFKGSEKAEDALYLLALSNYENADYETAGTYFRQYYARYPKGKHAELSRFYCGYGYYLDSPEPQLDQSGTLKAINELQDFLDKNKTAADFDKNAPQANYTALPAKVTPSTPQLGRLDDSRDMVAWAMKAKKGQVSPIFGDESAGRLVAVALNDIYESGYIPATDPDVRQALLIELRNNKKAADLIGQYKGKAKDLAGYSKLMGVDVDTTTVNFGQIFIPGLGVGESEITAQVANAKKGQLVGPIQGSSGVIVLQVNSIDNAGRPYNFDESAMMYNQQRGVGVLMRQITPILVGKKKVTNNMLEFFNRN